MTLQPREAPPSLVDDNSDHTSDQSSNDSLPMESNWDPVSSATDWIDQAAVTMGASSELGLPDPMLKHAYDFGQGHNWDQSMSLRKRISNTNAMVGSFLSTRPGIQSNL